MSRLWHQVQCGSAPCRQENHLQEVRRADHHAVRVLEIRDRAAFAQEFRVGDHGEPGIGPGVRDLVEGGPAQRPRRLLGFIPWGEDLAPLLT